MRDLSNLVRVVEPLAEPGLYTRRRVAVNRSYALRQSARDGRGSIRSRRRNLRPGWLQDPPRGAFSEALLAAAAEHTTDGS